MSMNTSRRRKFTDEEKRRIVDDALLRGINVILHEQRLSYSVFAQWKKKFYPQPGVKERDDKKMVQQLNDLMAENEQLKKIIANLMLESQMKNSQQNIKS